MPDVHRASPAQPKLLPTCRNALRTAHYSPRTEAAYLGWVRRFVRFHELRHPLQMGEREVAAYLTHLATERMVSASTQQQALSALLFLYREVLQRPLGNLGSVLRAPGPARIPVVLRRRGSPSGSGGAGGGLPARGHAALRGWPPAAGGDHASGEGHRLRPGGNRGAAGEGCQRPDDRASRGWEGIAGGTPGGGQRLARARLGRRRREGVAPRGAGSQIPQGHDGMGLAVGVSGE